MSRLGGALSKSGGLILGWWARYLGWLMLTAAITLGGALLLMLFKDWTLKSLFAAMMAWPALAMGTLLAIPAAFLPLGRIYLFSAIALGLLYNLALLAS